MTNVDLSFRWKALPDRLETPPPRRHPKTPEKLIQPKPEMTRQDPKLVCRIRKMLPDGSFWISEDVPVEEVLGPSMSDQLRRITDKLAAAARCPSG